jgi:parallel beta-helix repeat protein
MCATALTGQSLAQEPIRHAEVRVGIDAGDFRGSDQRALQAAVDYVAGLGGGTVRIEAGRYVLRNALMLRDNVHIIGTGGKAVLAACEGTQCKLTADGDCNERQITVADPGAFRVGDGVVISDDQHGSGFAVTTATLTAQVDKHTFRISKPLYLDYMVSLNAKARLAFPLLSGEHVKNAVIEGLTLEGRGKKSEYLDGCRGGGIYLFECQTVTIRNCTVRAYNGDGISFQVSKDITVEECECEQNLGLGLHPGSGSQHPVLRRNHSKNNGGDGLFVCWRVKHGHFEDNQLCDNKGAGISIGHKDTDNVFRGNTITGNARTGVLFRDEMEAMGAHRNVFKNNRIVDNGGTAGKKPPLPNVVIQGHHHDVVFQLNTIGYSQPANIDVGIRAGPEAKRLQAEENLFQNVKLPVKIESK